jgi:acyl-CoA synthetase (AMP-forming)/AMP-acid ligase II
MLREQFDSVARQFPEAVALVDGEARVTYADLMARAGRFARHLVEQAGLRRGDLVAACLPNCWEVVAGFLATAGMGAVWMPFHSQWRTREFAWFAGRLRFRVLVTNIRLQDPWRDGGVLPPSVVLVDHPDVQDRLLTSAAGLPVSPSPEDQPCVYLATSGSTGRPRVVPRTQANLVAVARNTAAALGVQARMRILSVVPFHYAFGFQSCMLLPLLHGATAVLLPSFTPASLEAAVARERIQFLMASPFIYAMLLESGISRASFASVEIAVSSGARMSQDLLSRCADRLGLHVRQLYGTSETGAIAIESPGVPVETGTAGHPVRSVEIRILDEHGQCLGPGCTGEIAVRGPGVMTGYIDEPDLNRDLFLDGFFRTGDLGRLDPSGVLILSGRSKAILNIGGIKVDPVEIEDVLLEMPEVRDCAVHGVHDERQGEIVAAIIAVRPGCALSRQAVVAHCRERLAEFKIPRQLELVDSLPVEVTGKKPRAWKTD